MMSVAIKSNVRTPTVLWYQNDGYIVLRIMLTDVKKYFLLVDMDHIRFSTIHDNEPYYLCTYFFGAIIPEKTINKNLGREIKVQIPKAHKFLRWPRLQYHQSKLPQIVLDTERYEEGNWMMRKVHERPWTDFEEYKKKNNIILRPADLSSSDDGESNDERDYVLSD